MKYLFTFIVSLFFVVSVQVSFVLADWQATLEENFDIVDTFDNLQPWSGLHNGGQIYINDYPDDFPKKLDGSPSIWGAYSQFYTGSQGHKEDWIGPHGANHWSGTQSLCINYGSLYCDGDTDIEKGYGAERMLTYLENGYDEMYTFYMQYLPLGFFREDPENPGTLVYGAIAKVFTSQRGFNDVKNFKCPDGSIGTSSYGVDWYLDGIGGYSSGLYNYTVYGTQRDSTSCGYNGQTEVNQFLGIETPYFDGEWFAVERRYKNNSTLGAADGENEIWVYDMNGNQIGHGLIAGINNRSYSEEKFNRIEFGGNYQCVQGVNGYGGNPKFYIDDFIIDDQRIGPTYFALHAGTPPPVDNKPKNTKAGVSVP